MSANYGWYMAITKDPKGVKTNFPISKCDYEYAASFSRYLAMRGYEVTLVQVMDKFPAERFDVEEAAI